MKEILESIRERWTFPFLIWFIITLSITATYHLPLGKTEGSTLNSTDFAALKEILIGENTISVKRDKLTPHKIFKLGAGKLVLDLTNTKNSWKKKEVVLKNNSFFSKVRASQFQNNPTKIARVVIELKSPVEYQTVLKENTILITVRKSEEKIQESSNIHSEQTQPQTLDAIKAVPTPLEKIVKTGPKKTASLVQAIPQSEPSVSPGEDASKNLFEPTSLFGRQLVTLDFYDIDLLDLLKVISEKSGINIVYGNDISGTVSVQLRDVPFKDAVDTILSLKNLRMIALGKNILQVMTPQEFDSYKVNAISLTKVFPINYAKASDVDTQLKSILTTLGGKGKTLVDDRTNSIIVTDTPEGIEAISKLILDLDKATPQVMIEAKIVQISLGKSIDLGITWGAAYTDQSGNQMVTIGATKIPKGLVSGNTSGETPGSGTAGLMTKTPLAPGAVSDLETAGAGFSAAQGLGLSFGFVKDVVRLNAALSALQQKKKSKLLSNPKIATLNNQSAFIKSQVSDPYITTETQLTNAGTLTSQKVSQSISGINLTVTPTINADGRITMKILPDVTSSQPTSIGIPKTTSQQASTTVIVKDGETFVIGGLISELESDDRAKVPILGSIPILGHLFKKTGKAKTRAELLVFVTPKIIPY